MLCFDVASLEAETLFAFLYYIPYFQNGSTEVYLPEGDVDRKFSSMANVIE